MRVTVTYNADAAGPSHTQKQIPNDALLNLQLHAQYTGQDLRNVILTPDLHNTRIKD